jgi:hypothetical protein
MLFVVVLNLVFYIWPIIKYVMVTRKLTMDSPRLIYPVFVNLAICVRLYFIFDLDSIKVMNAVIINWKSVCMNLFYKD